MKETWICLRRNGTSSSSSRRDLAKALLAACSSAHSDIQLIPGPECRAHGKNRTPISTWKISALNDGLEPIGFELLARTRCGLIVRIWPDLNAKVFIRAGRDDKRGEFFLLQGLRQSQRVILVQHGSDLKHDGAFRNQ
jgi:hypothetical protein